jgi:hypothetical protein
VSGTTSTTLLSLLRVGGMVVPTLGRQTTSLYSDGDHLACAAAPIDPSPPRCRVESVESGWVSRVEPFKRVNSLASFSAPTHTRAVCDCVGHL